MRQQQEDTVSESNETKNPDDVLTSTEAAAVVGLSPRTMARLITIGAVDGRPREWSGRAGHRILRSAVLSWVERGMPRPADDEPVKPAPKKKTRAKAKAAKAAKVRR